MGHSKYAGTVKIGSELKEGGYWVVESDDLPGLVLCGKVLKKLIADVPNAIKMLFKLNYGMEVDVNPATSDPRLVGIEDSHTVPHQAPDCWVTMPSSECHA